MDGVAHTLLGARETGAVLLARLGAVGSSLGGRGGLLSDRLHRRLGDIGALVIVTWGGASCQYGGGGQGQLRWWPIVYGLESG